MTQSLIFRHHGVTPACYFMGMYSPGTTPSLSTPAVSPVASADSRPTTGRHEGKLAAFRIPITRAAVVLLAAALIFTRSTWAEGEPILASVLIFAGLLLTGIAAAGRLWCSLYIAGRKNRSLVMDGPYSVSRNPLYLFSLLGAVGATMTTGILSLPLALALLFLWSYRPVIQAEEKRLTGLFGGDYRAYCHRVPRFWPRLRQLHFGDSPEVNARVFLDHALCVIWFPAAAGLLAMIHAIQISLQLPVWFRLF